MDGTKSQDLIDAIGGEFLDGFKGTAPLSSATAPGAASAWDEAYIAEFGELPTTPFVRESYDAAIAIALAAEMAGSTDGAAIRDALVQIASPPGATVTPGADSIAAALTAVRNGEDINYEGGATTLDWNPDGDVTSGFIGIWQFEGGAIVEVGTGPLLARIAWMPGAETEGSGRPSGRPLIGWLHGATSIPVGRCGRLGCRRFAE